MRNAMFVPGHGALAIPRIGRPFDLVIPDVARRVKEKFRLVAVGFSNAFETAVLEHVVGKTTLTVSSPTYLALCTAAVDDTKTGSTITEASYTGYARKSVAGSDWAAAVAGDPSSSIATANGLTFANCTAGSSTVTYWALVTASSAGNVIMWGTCPSTVISTTQTPATVAAGALSLTAD